MNGCRRIIDFYVGLRGTRGARGYDGLARVLRGRVCVAGCFVHRIRHQVPFMAKMAFLSRSTLLLFALCILIGCAREGGRLAVHIGLWRHLYPRRLRLPVLDAGVRPDAADQQARRGAGASAVPVRRNRHLRGLHPPEDIDFRPAEDGSVSRSSSSWAARYSCSPPS